MYLGGVTGKEALSGMSERLQSGVRELPRGQWIMFVALAMVMVSGLYTYVRTDELVLFKWAQFIVCQLQLTKAVF